MYSVDVDVRRLDELGDGDGRIKLREALVVVGEEELEVAAAEEVW